MMGFRAMTQEVMNEASNIHSMNPTGSRLSPSSLTVQKDNTKQKTV